MAENNKDEELEDILLFAASKLNMHNSFDINANFIKDIAQRHNNEDEEGWVRTSESIAAASKIYGLRVDHVNNKVYRVLNWFHRTDNGKRYLLNL